MTVVDPGLALLPEGITVLEASAGTGKTHRVATEAVTPSWPGRRSSRCCWSPSPASDRHPAPDLGPVVAAPPQPSTPT